MTVLQPGFDTLWRERHQPLWHCHCRFHTRFPREETRGDATNELSHSVCSGPHWHFGLAGTGPRPTPHLSRSRIRLWLWLSLVWLRRTMGSVGSVLVVRLVWPLG